MFISWLIIDMAGNEDSIIAGLGFTTTAAFASFLGFILIVIRQIKQYFGKSKRYCYTALLIISTFA